jgi:nitrous-oxide reductase
VTPDGKYMVVAGKLDPHVTIYSFDKIQQAIADKNWTTDEFGIPVLDFDAVMLAQVELGLGPLHTQFDDQGNAYTSLFLDSALAKWTLGGDDPAGYHAGGKTPVQYNIGHIAAAEGDTVSPDGQYLVALNKWAVDRFLPVGPLLPQNEQLIDIGGTADQGDLRHADGHRRAALRADDQGRQAQAWEVYPEVGWDPTPSRSPSTPPCRRGAHRARRQQRDHLHDLDPLAPDA